MFFVLLVFIILLLFFPRLRFCVKHPITVIKGGLSDIFDYFVHKRKNECKYFGKVFLFSASGSSAFGSGKTLSMIRFAVSLYKHYNNLPVWDDETQSFVRQRIIIISNVELKTIPYIPFIGKDQFINIDKLEHTEHDIILFLIDEAGTEFNSRNYKDNLPTSFLERLLQIRKHKICVCMTAQRFTFVDKVLRQICGVVTTCSMKWRIVCLQDYDAFSLENLNNPEMLQPLSTRYYFASNELFNSYDTTYTVEKLKTQLEEGDLLDTSEILERIGDSSDPVNATPKLRQKYRKRKRR